MANTNALARIGSSLLADSNFDTFSATGLAGFLHDTLESHTPPDAPEAQSVIAAVRSVVGVNVTKTQALNVLQDIVNLPSGKAGDGSITGILLLTLAIFAVCSRLFWTITKDQRRRLWNDIFLIISLLFAGAYVVSYTSLSYSSTVLKSHSWNVSLKDLRSLVRTNFITDFLYIISLAFTKFSLLASYYAYLFSKGNSFAKRTAFWCLAIFVACCTSATLFGSFGLCGEFHFWNSWPNLAAAKCTDLSKASLAAGVLDVLQVASLMLFPVTFVLTPSRPFPLSPRETISWVLIVTSAMVTLVSSIMRTSKLSKSYSSPDLTRSTIPVIQWTEAELCIALVTVSLLSILFPQPNISNSPYPTLPRPTSTRQYSPRKHFSKLAHSTTSSLRNLRDSFDTSYEYETVEADRSSTATVVHIRRISDAEKPRLREICISPTSPFSPARQKFPTESHIPQKPRPALLHVHSSSLSDVRVFKTSRVSVYEIDDQSGSKRQTKDSVEMVDVEIGFDCGSYNAAQSYLTHRSGQGYEPRGADWQLKLDLETGHNRSWKDVTGLKTSVTGGV